MLVLDLCGGGGAPDLAKFLSKIEGENRHCEVGILESGQLGEFVGDLRTGKVNALLVIVLPAQAWNRVDECLRTDATCVWREIVSLLNNRKWEILEQRLVECSMAIAEVACESGSDSVLLLSSSDSRPSSQSTASTHVRSDRLAGRPFRFRLGFADELTNDFFGALRGARKCRLNNSEMRLKAFGPTAGGWDDFVLTTTKERDSWYRIEMFDEDVRLAALRMAESLRCAACSDEKARRVLITCLRVCKELSKLTLEGHPFNCTFFLTSHYEEEVRTAGERNELIVFADADGGDAIYFNFRDWDRLCRAAELVQSPDLWLTIDTHDCAVRSLVSWKSSHHARHIALSNEVTDSGVLIHVHEAGKVEVYAKREMQLWFDGTRWCFSPFSVLRATLENFMRDEDGKLAQYGRDHVEKIEGAVAELMDHRESSIFVLLSGQDEAYLNEILAREQGEFREIQSLRMDCSEIDPIALSSLSVKGLAGLLHTDGAHFFSQSGTLLRLAQRIVGSKQGAENSLPASVGAGRHAAREAARIFCRGSRVVKVSASGDLKIFPWKQSPPGSWFHEIKSATV